VIANKLWQLHVPSTHRSLGGLFKKQMVFVVYHLFVFLFVFGQFVRMLVERRPFPGSIQ